MCVRLNSVVPPEPVRCDVDGPSTPKSRRSQPCPSLEEASGSVSSKPHLVFIKSFMFQPDLPIRFDYEAKGFKTEMVRLLGWDMMVWILSVFLIAGYHCWYTIWVKSPQ